MFRFFFFWRKNTMGKLESKTVTFGAKDNWETITATLQKLEDRGWQIEFCTAKKCVLRRDKKKKKGKKTKK